MNTSQFPVRVSDIAGIVEDSNRGVISLVGDHGGLSLITGEIAPSSLMTGMISIETEHGTVHLDPEVEVTISEETQHDKPEQVFTPEAPRYPEVSVNLIGEDASILSIVTRVRTALRRHGVEPDVLDELVTTVTGKGGYEAALHEVTCWVSVGTPGVDDED